MKIIQYLPYSYHIHTGGLEKIAQTLCDGLNKESNIEIKNVSSDIRRGPGQELEKYNDTFFVPSFDLVYNFPVPKIWTKGFWGQFKHIKAYKPDVIITHTRFFIQSLVGGMIAKWLGTKRIHIEHGSGFVTGYTWYIKFFAWICDWTVGLRIFRQCDQIVTISQSHHPFIKKFTNKKPIVIYNPIDYKSKKKIKNSIPHIGFIGRLVTLKGVDVLIESLALMQQESWKCTIVGTGDQDKHLQGLVEKKGLSDRIIFVGADDRRDRLHKFDILVNPSLQEGLPTTVVEGLLAKCIVVATDVGGTREISNKKDLIIVKPNDRIELEKGIRLAFQSLDKSGLSYTKVMEKFGINNIIKTYRKIL